MTKETTTPTAGSRVLLPKLAIVTHGGMFHADEVYAIALLDHFSEEIVAIERTFDPKAAIENLKKELDEHTPILAIDIGRHHKPELYRFDHHQDEQLEASCCLIADYLKDTGVMMEYEYEWLKPLLLAISEVDKGVKKAGDAEVNGLIRCFNTTSGDAYEKTVAFDNACMIAHMHVEQMLRLAGEARKDYDRYHSTKKDGLIRITDEKEPILTWRTLAEDEGTLFMIIPSDRVEGQYNLISRDSEIAKVPEKAPGMVFRHNSGFMGTFLSKGDALYAGKMVTTATATA